MCELTGENNFTKYNVGEPTKVILLKLMYA